MAGLAGRLCSAVLLAASGSPIAQAASYPTRTVEIIVSYAAGGSTDFVARTVAQRLTDKLGQPFVVLNRPGASGTIGLKAAMAAKPDGYTLYVGYTSETVVVPQISRTAAYSATDDFEPVAVTGLVPVVLIVSKNVKADNLKDFIAEVRANPGKYTYGGSVGSPPHIMGAWMNNVRELQVQHIPYRGGAQGVTDVVGGHLDMFYGGVAVAKSAIEGGNVKALAVTGDARSAALPDVPTFKEAGVPEFDLASWTVMLAPKGTPADIVDLVRKESIAAIEDPATRAALAKQGVDRSPSQDVRAFLLKERNNFGRAVRTLGIKMGE
ncbi:MAG: tripartite tricarboxylate transporter substrate binding protein [Hyphomicrobiales bacterium]|nr:tripartite tricarboxylate transporter substrate binding protein [Alphaproteobacteria bacterium]